MALFHLHVTQVKRSAGQSIVTSTAYRAGEKLYSEYYGEVSDYTHKSGVVCTDILLPPQAPAEYQDRATLWNTVEKAERGKKAQLAYRFDIALQNEFSLEENIPLGRQFVSEQLVGSPSTSRTRRTAASRTRTFTFSVLSGLSRKAANGVVSSAAATVWTRTGTASWARTASPSLTLFPLPTGGTRKRWSIGERRGPLW